MDSMLPGLAHGAFRFCPHSLLRVFSPQLHCSGALAGLMPASFRSRASFLLADQSDRTGEKIVDSTDHFDLAISH